MDKEIKSPVLDLSKLRSEREDKLDFKVDWFDVPEIFSGIKPIEPVILSGAVTKRPGFYDLSLDLEITFETNCARCLRDLKTTSVIHSDKVVVFNQPKDDENDDYVVMNGNELDLFDTANELMYLELPSTVLCDENCKGLCQRCGKNLNEGPCNCGKEIDPRMEIFRKYLNDNEN